MTSTRSEGSLYRSRLINALVIVGAVSTVSSMVFGQLLLFSVALATFDERDLPDLMMSFN